VEPSERLLLVLPRLSHQLTGGGTQMRLTSKAEEIRKIAADLPKFLEKWAGRRASVTMTGSIVTFEGLVLPGALQSTIINGRWNYGASIIVRTTDEDVEIDFLDVAGARSHP
jgi:hypothetical protein